MLRGYGRQRGVRLVGDVPIYRGGRQLRPPLAPRAVPGRRRGRGAAGRPRARRASSGATRVFDWDAMAADGYRWWIERLRRVLSLVDLTRIDHFRGFASYWEVPAARRARSTAAG